MVLLTYAVVASYMVPMEPGIVQTSLDASGQSSWVADVQGYNTHFGDQELFAWLCSENRGCVIPFSGYEVSGPEHIRLFFPAHDTLNTDLLHLYLSGSKDHTMFYPSLAVPGNPVVDASFEMGEWPADYVIKDEGFNIPFQNILYETIRNLNFHVTMWFTTMALFLISLIFSIRTLSNGVFLDDAKARIAVELGLFFTALGLITGALWAKNTWGAWWVNDPKLNGAAVSALIYLAYIVLRRSVPDIEKRQRLAAVYNIFAFVMFLVFIQILPRFTDSLHPGNGGNPAFSGYDLDSNLRAIFYPATAGFVLLGIWIWELQVRRQKWLMKHEQDWN